jgi:type II secretory pathway component PulF
LNHLQLLLNSPVMYIGALSFRSRRRDVYESLLIMLDRAGRSSVRTVGEVFAEWAERERRRGDTVARVYAHVANNAAHSLAEGLRPFIDNDEYLILVSGETGGDLLQALRALLENSKAQEEMSRATAGEFFLPVVGLLSLIGLSLMFGQELWPTFATVIPERFWPTYMAPCVYTQIWLRKHWEVLLVVPALWLLYVQTKSFWVGRLRSAFDHLPPWSVYRGRLAANTLCMLAALISSGMTVREAFVKITEGGDPYLRWHIRWILRRYDAAGENALPALRTSFFSRQMLDRVEDAASGRSFDEALMTVSTRSLTLVVRGLKVQAATAAGIVSVVVGVLFMYVTFCQVFGMQEATDRYVASVQGKSGVTP